MNDVRCGSIELEAMTAVWFIDWLYRFMISGLSTVVELLFSIVEIQCLSYAVTAVGRIK